MIDNEVFSKAIELNNSLNKELKDIIQKIILNIKNEIKDINIFNVENYLEELRMTLIKNETTKFIAINHWNKIEMEIEKELFYWR